METIVLENHNRETQYAYDDKGIRHAMEGHEVRAFLEPIARLFLNQRGRYVHVYQPLNVPERPGEPKVWVANCTGNPYLPDEIIKFDRDPKTGERVKSVSPNPLKVPLVIKHMMHQGQVEADTNWGKTFLNLPPVQISIPPFYRYPFPKSIGMWLVERDANNEEDCRGRVMLCRAPTDYEPNETWPLNAILAYSRLVDEAIILPEFKPEEVFKGNREKIEEVKQKVLRRLFFRLIDQRFALPPENAVRAATEQMMTELVERSPKQAQTR